MSQPTPRFAIAVVANLVPGTSITTRRSIDRERFDETLSKLAPGLDFEVPDALTNGAPRRISLRFDSWRDFTPSGLIEQVPELGRVHALLERLSQGEADAAALARDAEGLAPPAWIEALRERPDSNSPAPSPGPSPAETAPAVEGTGSAAGILDLIDTGGGNLDASEQDTARRIVDGLTSRTSHGDRKRTQISSDATLELQSRFDAQLEAILRDPGFRALERDWAGLRWLVRRTDFREDIAMEIVASPAESAAEAVESLAGGDDVDVVLAAYEYDASPRDFERVQDLARAGETIQTAVITSLAPGFCGCDSWDELGGGDSPRAIFAGEAYSAWRSLRDKEESRWLVLVANRFAIRGRYAPDEESTRGVAFTESAPGGLLAPGAWGIGAVLTRSWSRTRSCIQISGSRNGLVLDLPLLAHTAKPLPVEGSFGSECRQDLESFGITAVQHHRDDAAFVGAVRAFRAPEKFPNDESTADSAQQVTLAYQILVSRLVKLLRFTLPDLIDLSREEVENKLCLAVLAHFSLPGKPLAPDHVGVGLEDDPEDAALTLVRLRVQPEATIAGRPVNILLNFAVSL